MATENKQISKEVLDAAKLVAAALPALETKGSEATTTLPREEYTSFLYDDLINDNVLKHLNDKNTTFFAGATKAVGDKALEQFKKNPDLQEVNAIVKLHGRDQLEIRVQRSKETSAPGSDTKITNYGVVSVGLKSSAARAKSGELFLVRESLKSAALEALSK